MPDSFLVEARPPLLGACKRCGVTAHDIAHRPGIVIVSPRRIAHYEAEYGMTACGKDATGEFWWWPE